MHENKNILNYLKNEITNWRIITKLTMTALLNIADFYCVKNNLISRNNENSVEVNFRITI